MFTIPDTKAGRDTCRAYILGLGAVGLGLYLVTR